MFKLWLFSYLFINWVNILTECPLQFFSKSQRLEKQYFLSIIISVLRVCCLDRELPAGYGPWLFDVAPSSPARWCLSIGFLLAHRQRQMPPLRPARSEPCCDCACVICSVKSSLFQTLQIYPLRILFVFISLSWQQNILASLEWTSDLYMTNCPRQGIFLYWLRSNTHW